MNVSFSCYLYAETISTCQKYIHNFTLTSESSFLKDGPKVYVIPNLFSESFCYFDPETVQDDKGLFQDAKGALKIRSSIRIIIYSCHHKFISGSFLYLKNKYCFARGQGLTLLRVKEQPV